jgi:hypothetical protein
MLKKRNSVDIELSGFFSQNPVRYYPLKPKKKREREEKVGGE